MKLGLFAGLAGVTVGPAYSLLRPRLMQRRSI
jgi:hypothetical protein